MNLSEVSITNRTFVFNFLFYLLIGTVKGFGLYDFDNLLERNAWSIHVVIVQFLNPPALVLIVVNIAIISYVLTFIYNRNKFLYFLLIVNPFLILNVIDAYNRFSFTVLVFVVSYLCINKNKFSSCFSIAAAFSLHPFNSFALFQRNLVDFKFVLYLPLLFVLLYLLHLTFDFEELLSANAKYQLFINSAGNVAELYSGNMVLKPIYTDFSFIGFMYRLVAMIFPYGFIVDNSIGVLFISLYNLILLFSCLIYLSLQRVFILVNTFLLIAFIVGNFAVFQRHILPILIFLIWSENRFIKYRFS